MSPAAASAAAPIARRERLPGAVAAGREALLVDGDPAPFALTGRWAGARALVGSCPVRHAPAGADPFALLADPGPPPADPPPGFVGGGWFGYLGYPLAPGPALRPRRLPPFVLARYDHLLRLDADGEWWFEALWTPARDGALAARRDALAARLAAARVTARAPRPFATEPWTSTPTPDGHGRAVAAARRRIEHGDLYQANVSLRLRSRFSGAPVDLFTAAAAALQPDRAAFLAGDWGAAASLSPELFLRRSGNTVTSRPIKGTRRRDPDPERASAARIELSASAKDRAENVMIVDLVRNDLGRVARPGSVAVGQLAEVEAHPGVWHLVSEVHATLADGADDAALLRAAFPPGSVTGAPKLAAIAVIDELESAGRELFTGAIGFGSPAAGLELSVVIRTFEIAGDEIWLDVGGGIVADSDPAAEAAEALVKARPLLEAIGARVPGLVPAPTAAARAARVPPPPRLSPVPPVRPDARGGLLETIKLSAGRPVLLREHLARLADSMRELYGTVPDLRELAARVADAPPGAGRVRVSVTAEGTVDVAHDAGPAVPRAAETLAPVTVSGGLGAHKWLDRRWLDALLAASAPATPLLVDLDGRVLESASAAVLVVDPAGRLLAPPLDGRILPGVTRAAALAAAPGLGLEVVVRPIALTELATAHEVILASAIRGVRGAERPGPVADALARALDAAG